MKGHGGSEQYQHTARGHGTSWSRYHRCLAESHDLPALSRLHHFRPVDVRLPHQHAVRPAVDLGSTSTEEHVLEQMELNTGTGQTYIALAAIRIALARKGLS